MGANIQKIIRKSQKYNNFHLFLCHLSFAINANQGVKFFV